MFFFSYVSTDTAMILVANKSDLVRNRVVQTAGNGYRVGYRAASQRGASPDPAPTKLRIRIRKSDLVRNHVVQTAGNGSRMSYRASELRARIRLQPGQESESGYK